MSTSDFNKRGILGDYNSISNLNPRKVAFCGDWHGDTRYALDQIKRLGEMGVDVLVHAGDFGMYRDAGKYLRKVNFELAKYDMKALVVDGNHSDHQWLRNQMSDQDSPLHLLPNLVYLPRGFVWEWEGTKFMAFGGAYSVNRHITQSYGGYPIKNWDDLEVPSFAELAKAESRGPVDVMVTHDCPITDKIEHLLPKDIDWPEEHLKEARGYSWMLNKLVSAVTPRVLFHGHLHIRHTTLASIGNRTVLVEGLDMNNHDKSMELNAVVYNTREICP